jgi:hypothetical protein
VLLEMFRLIPDRDKLKALSLVRSKELHMSFVTLADEVTKDPALSKAIGLDALSKEIAESRSQRALYQNPSP